MSNVDPPSISCVELRLPVGGIWSLASEQLATPTTHAERGLDFARAGQLEKAEAELRQAVELAPSDVEVLATLGTVLAQEQKLEESTELFRRALRINSSNLTVRRYLAANLWQLHRYPEAKGNLQIILKRKPDDKAAQLLLGMVSENMGDYATAARMLAAVPEKSASNRSLSPRWPAPTITCTRPKKHGRR